MCIFVHTPHKIENGGPRDILKQANKKFPLIANDFHCTCSLFYTLLGAFFRIENKNVLKTIHTC